MAPPRTVYRGIKQLPASGQILVQFAENGCALTISGGYFPPDRMAQDQEEADISKRVTDLLLNSVGRLKPAARSVATLLSGGVDSSLLCALAERELGAYDTYSSS